MWKSGILHSNTGDLWRTSFWFTYQELWILRICSQKYSVGYSTTVTPPTSLGTMAILAGKLSWFYFQLPFPPRQWKWVLLIFIFDDYIGLTLKFFRLALSFQLWCAVFASGEGVSGPVVRHTDETRARCFTNGYLRIQHDHRRCNGIEMISSRSLNKSSLFRYFILYVVWLD